jgi:integrase/recombinase XerD
MAGIDPCTEIPPPGLIGYRQRRRPPFIFSDADITGVMVQARAIRYPLPALTYQTLIGLLAVTGMRVGEALRLDGADINWDEGLLLIRESKFTKSRQIALHATAVDALARYCRRRDEIQPSRQTPAVFVSMRGTRVIYAVVQEVFRNCCRAAGVGTGMSATPRVHDLRHSFAVGCLLRWYREGAEVQSRLPWLSAYLGHKDPRSTYWYLSAAPELLACESPSSPAWTAATSSWALAVTSAAKAKGASSGPFRSPARPRRYSGNGQLNVPAPQTSHCSQPGPGGGSAATPSTADSGSTPPPRRKPAAGQPRRRPRETRPDRQPPRQPRGHRPWHARIPRVTRRVTRIGNAQHL